MGFVNFTLEEFINVSFDIWANELALNDTTPTSIKLWSRDGKLLVKLVAGSYTPYICDNCPCEDNGICDYDPTWTFTLDVDFSLFICTPCAGFTRTGLSLTYDNVSNIFGYTQNSNHCTTLSPPYAGEVTEYYYIGCSPELLNILPVLNTYLTGEETDVFCLIYYEQISDPSTFSYYLYNIGSTTGGTVRPTGVFTFSDANLYGLTSDCAAALALSTPTITVS